METRNRSKNIKKLHSGHLFTSIESFPSGYLPTKRNIIERILHFKNYRTKEASNAIAKEVHNLWIFCSVFPISEDSIAKKVVNLVESLGPAFLNKECEFMSSVDELFDVFCSDDTQRKELEKQYKLRMTPADHYFYEDQKGPRMQKCIDSVVPLNTSDELFIWRFSDQMQSSTPLPSTSSMSSSPSFIHLIHQIMFLLLKVIKIVECVRDIKSQIVLVQPLSLLF